jgi:MFS family permease
VADDSLLHSPLARWIALVVVCLGQLMSIVAGRLGDLIGRRRIFLIGVAGFTVASAACGFADSQGVLIVARFIQGLARAGAVSAIVAIITAEFPTPGERAKAMSIYTLVISGGASLGLIAGGLITEALNWHWIFFVNVPVGIVTVRLRAHHRVAHHRRLRDRHRQLARLGLGAHARLRRGVAGPARRLRRAGMAPTQPIMPLRVLAIPGLPSSSLHRPHPHAAGPRHRPGPRAAERLSARVPDRRGVRGGGARRARAVGAGAPAG